MNLTGKTAIVTGGSRGIGKAIVTRLAAEEATVVIADLDEKRAEALTAELKSVSS